MHVPGSEHIYIYQLPLERIVPVELMETVGGALGSYIAPASSDGYVFIIRRIADGGKGTRNKSFHFTFVSYAPTDM